MARINRRLKHAWNAFTNQRTSDRIHSYGDYGASYGFRPGGNSRFSIGNERSIVASIYTRMAVDVASNEIKHVRLDDQGRYFEDIKSGLQDCLTVEANIDQAATQFRIDIALSLFNQGSIAIVPVDTTVSPIANGGFDIKTMRVGEIVAFYPRDVRISLYNEKLGRRDEIVLPKRMCAIVENPFYSVMNEPNSTLQRLIRKLNLLDSIDEQSASGKLDLIVQLPYVIKSDSKRAQADQRRRDIEFQLKGSKYGIAYTDGTEKITQLNRPAENNLMAQIEYLTDLLYSQLGLTDAIMNGTADEAAMLNYYNRTIKPIMDAVIEAMTRTFLTKTARSQNQGIRYFRNPFALVTIEDLAEIADKFTRNEIATGNEIRQAIGMRPSKDKKADELRNSNMPVDKDSGLVDSSEEDDLAEEELDREMRELGIDG